jgi:hypothetical protein
LINAISFHHSLEMVHLAQPVVACVHAADLCAKLALTGQPLVITGDVLDALNLTDNSFFEVVEELRERKDQMNKLLV